MRPSLLLASVLVFGMVSATARAATQTVPVDVGLGPAGFLLSGPIADDEPLHTGLSLSVAVVLDQETLKKHARRIPAKYRRRATALTEVRLSPSPFIPDHFFLSPKGFRSDSVGLYGVTFRPLALGAAVGSPRIRLAAGVGLDVTYAFVHGSRAVTTHFLRPGLDGRVELGATFTETLGLSVGWASTLYVPQEVGGFGVGALDESIWHIGQGFVRLHVRFPYEVKGA